MRVAELFAGVGGFRLGLERAGHEVVWANEWDRWAADVYDKNFGGEIDRRDITTVPADDIPAHDLLVGGFPCQAFSVAGKRLGFSETRGTLFFEVARLAKHHRTPYLLLENVKGLLPHDRGNTFETILRTLDKLGYDLQWQVLNSKDFGVPQNRERVFIIGHLRDRPRPQVFPIGATNRQAIASPTLSTRYHQRQAEGLYIIEAGDRWRLLTPLECERLQGFPDNWTVGVSDTQRYKMMGNAVTVNVVEAIGRQLGSSCAPPHHRRP